MHEIRSQRKKLGLSLEQLARRCGVSASYLSRCESGQRNASTSVLFRLRSSLGLSVEGVGAELPGSLVRRLRVAVPRVRSTRRADAWARVLQCHRGLLRRLGGKALPGWFREECDCDSAPEHVSLVHLLFVGALASRCSPWALGFVLHPLLTSEKQALGGEQIPCLYVRLGAVELVYFPQVSLRTGKRDCRVDGLVLCLIGRQKAWIMVEIDGAGHNERLDAERELCLGLPVLRISERAVLELRFVEELQTGLERIVRVEG